MTEQTCALLQEDEILSKVKGDVNLLFFELKDHKQFQNVLLILKNRTDMNIYTGKRLSEKVKYIVASTKDSASKETFSHLFVSSLANRITELPCFFSKTDKEIFYLLLEDSYPIEDIRACLGSLLYEKAFAEELIQKSIMNLSSFPWFNNEKDLVKMAVEKDPISIKYASKYLNDDVEFIKELLEVNPNCYQFLNKKMASDKNLAEKSFELLSSNYIHMPISYKLDLNYAIKFIQTNDLEERYIDSIPDELFDERKILILLLNNEKYKKTALYKMKLEKWINDDEITRKTIFHSFSTQRLHKKYKKDRNFILELVDGLHFYHIPELYTFIDLKDDREIVLRMIKTKADIYRMIPKELTSDEEILKLSLMNNIECFLQTSVKLDEKWYQYIIDSVTQSYEQPILKLIPKEYLKVLNLKECLLKNADNFNFVDKFIYKNDKEFLKNVFLKSRNGKEVLNYYQFLREDHLFILELFKVKKEVFQMILKSKLMQNDNFLLDIVEIDSNYAKKIKTKSVSFYVKLLKKDRKKFASVIPSEMFKNNEVYLRYKGMYFLFLNHSLDRLLDIKISFL